MISNQSINARYSGRPVWQYPLILVLLLITSQSMQASPSQPLVVAGQAETRNIIEEVPLTGTVAAVRAASLSTEVDGLVQEVAVEVGDQVSKGDTLLRLDSTIEALNLESAQAETLRISAQLEDAKRRLKDAQRLSKQNNISLNELRLLQAEVETETAALKRQQADERRQAALLKRHNLNAPFDGVISERMTELGEWVEPGTAVLTLVAVDNLRLEFRVPQDYFMRIDDQSEISVVLDAMPDRQLRGQIQAVVPVTDPTARTFLMHVLLNDGEIKMSPGMSVHGRLRLNTATQGVVVNRDALIRYPDGRITVWVVKQDQSEPEVSERLVKTANSFNGLITITDGLQAGEIVVIEGNESLQEGQQVRIQNQSQAK
jgi:membrane fusion protein (multidrug efflux system)